MACALQTLNNCFFLLRSNIENIAGLGVASHIYRYGVNSQTWKATGGNKDGDWKGSFMQMIQVCNSLEPLVAYQVFYISFVKVNFNYIEAK